MTRFFNDNQWALILGGSSGFGLATAKKMSAQGMSVCVVHRDRRGSMARIEKEFNEIRGNGTGFVALNLDALSPEGIEATRQTLVEKLGTNGKIRLLLHSIALGNLKPIAPVGAQLSVRGAAARDTLTRLAQRIDVDVSRLEDAVSGLFKEGAAPLFPLASSLAGDFSNDCPLLDEEDMSRTIYSMGTNLLSWVRKIFEAGLFAKDARVIGLTSEGNEIAWRGYAAVAAAKSALESVSRAIAVEYGQYGIRSNIVQPGVTDTPALRVIPGNAQMRATAELRNPLGRLTLPEDVANVICLLCTDEAQWINGSLIRVDGGEHVTSV